MASPYDRNISYAKPAPAGGYLTALPQDQEKAFQQWVSQNNVPFDPSSQADYDMRGFWKGLMSGDPRATTAINPNDRQLHFPDYWKTPYHKSFSAESMWATEKAPSWNEKDQLVTPDGKVVFDERADTRVSKKMAVYEVATPDGQVFEIEGPEGADPSQIIAQLRGPDSSSPVQKTPPSALKQALMAPVGAAEIMFSGATSLPAKAIAGLGGLATEIGNQFSDTPADSTAVIRDIERQLTYQPRSDSAKAGLELMGQIADTADRRVIEPALEKVGSVSPVAENVVRTVVPAAVDTALTAAPLAKGLTGGAFRVNEEAARAAAERQARAPMRGSRIPSATTAEEVLARNAAGSQENMGAAAAAPRLQEVSHELKQAIVETARKNGGAVNQEALLRHIDADSLPVRIHLTEGQATGDVNLLSQEMNSRGKFQQLAEHFNAQNRALAENVRAIRDEVGPDVFSTNAVEHGDTLINAYRAVDSVAEAQISEAYSALRNASGGKFPVGARTLLDNASQELHRQLIFDHAPKSVMNALGRFAEKPGSMTFENFEALRTNLATIQRSSTDGLERRAAGVIRQAMEELPLTPGASRLKPLADRARALARERFQAIEADPAYAAAINDSTPPDRFVQKFVINGTRDNLARMRGTIGGDDTAAQTIGVAVMDYLRDQARLNPNYEGNFAAASYNKALNNNLAPKIRILLPANVVEQVEQLGRVASYTTAQPRGSFVNNSNTFVAAAGSHAVDALEGAANVAAAGIPIGTWTRKGFENAAAKRQVERSIASGAGLDRPSSPTQ